MSDLPHLDSHHRATCEKIHRHPTSHNIQWHDVISLLESLGECKETKHGSYECKIDGQLHVFTGPLHRELDDQQVRDMRKLLDSVGLTKEVLGVH
jgi:hypothetical protein